MAFEVYTPVRGRRVTSVEPEAVLGKGYLKINNAAWELIGEPERVVVLFDREERAVGLRAGSADEVDRRMTMALKRASANWMAMASEAFFRRYEIEATGVGIPVSLVDGILVIPVPDPPADEEVEETE